ncbi:MAG: MMPL family transporter [Lachnospiraceae bacterium]|nr:MMPL family transporter [Lachnospiraceae bacterium]
MSIAAIFLIVAILFQSLTIPIVLVSAIELAIFINQGIPYFTGAVIPFISPTVIGCIQLGATVDYAILITTRFREEIQNGLSRREAILIAAKTSDPSIITSALVLFCATLGVSIVSKIEIISSICVMLARGALISAVVSIFILPPVLYVCEPIFRKTSRRWKNGKTTSKLKESEA